MIIDTHVHIGGEAVGFTMNEDMVIEAMNKYGIDFAIVSNGDTTWVPMSTTLEAIKLYGSKKMMFGSDMPIDGVDTYLHNPKGERSLYQDYFCELPKIISKEEYDDVMYKNALRVFRKKK